MAMCTSTAAAELLSYKEALQRQTVGKSENVRFYPGLINGPNQINFENETMDIINSYIWITGSNENAYSYPTDEAARPARRILANFP